MGRTQNRQEGEELLDWTVNQGYDIINDDAQGPTFNSARGHSYIDMTMTRQTEVQDWTVDQDESLSLHSYITYTIKAKQNATKKALTFDFDNTNWTLLKTRLNYELNKQNWTMTNKQDVELKAQQMQTTCSSICKKYIRQKQKTNSQTDDEWWNEELEEDRRRTRQLRRTAQLETDLINRVAKELEYKSARNQYKKNIKKAKLEALQEQIQGMTECNPWTRLWKFLNKDRQRQPPTNILKEDGTYTQTDAERHDYLIEKYFPQDNPGDDTPEMTRTRTRVKQYDRQDAEANITDSEVRDIIKDMKKGKATTTDRIPNEALTHINEATDGILRDIYDKALSIGVFPGVWKRAEIVWLPKKDDGLRPISLLPTLGKILDKIINKRLQLDLERHEYIDKRLRIYGRHRDDHGT